MVLFPECIANLDVAMATCPEATGGNNINERRYGGDSRNTEAVAASSAIRRQQTKT